MKIKPLADRLVIKPIEKEKITTGGIVLPDIAQSKSQEGEVLAVGAGKLSENGNRVPMDIKIGDIIIYGKYAGSEVEYENDKLIILRESDILAIKI